MLRDGVVIAWNAVEKRLARIKFDGDNCTFDLLDNSQNSSVAVEKFSKITSHLAEPMDVATLKAKVMEGLHAL